MSNYTIKDCIQNKYRAYKDRALGKGREFTISLEFFEKEIQKDCHYCGLPSIDGMKHDYYNIVVRLNGLDRKDNALGYSEDNVVPSCTYCNFSKGDTDLGMWLRWCHRVANNPVKDKISSPLPHEDQYRMDKLRAKLQLQANGRKFRRMKNSPINRYT